MPAEMLLYIVVQRISLSDVMALRSTCVKYARMFSKKKYASFITCQWWAAEAVVLQLMMSPRVCSYVLAHCHDLQYYTRKYLHASDWSAVDGCKTLEAALIAEKRIEDVFHHPIHGLAALAVQNCKQIPTGQWIWVMLQCANVWEDMEYTFGPRSETLWMWKYRKEEAIARIYCLVYANAGEDLTRRYFGTVTPCCHHILAIIQYWAATGETINNTSKSGIIFVYDCNRGSHDGDPRRGLEFSVDTDSRTSRRLERTEFLANTVWRYLWNLNEKWTRDANILWWQAELAARGTKPGRVDPPTT